MKTSFHRMPSIGLCLLLLAGCKDPQTSVEPTAQPKARPVKIVTQQVNSLQRTYPGTLEASQHADLAFRVGDQLIELPVLFALFYGVEEK